MADRDGEWDAFNDLFSEGLLDFLDEEQEEIEKLNPVSTFSNVQLQSDIRRQELSSRTRTKRSRW